MCWVTVGCLSYQRQVRSGQTNAILRGIERHISSKDAAVLMLVHRWLLNNMCNSIPGLQNWWVQLEMGRTTDQGNKQAAWQEEITDLTPSAWRRQMCIMAASKCIREVSTKGRIDLLAWRTTLAQEWTGHKFKLASGKKCASDRRSESSLNHGGEQPA